VAAICCATPPLAVVLTPAVYAAGDAAAKGPPLMPVASHDGKPSVVFTLPPIAAVGLGEAEARGAGLKFRINRQKVPDRYTARRVAERVYGFKTLIEEGSGRILGAHLVGPHVDEVINIFGLAIRHGIAAEEIKQTIFAYPTGASDIGYML